MAMDPKEVEHGQGRVLGMRRGIGMLQRGAGMETRIGMEEMRIGLQMVRMQPGAGKVARAVTATQHN